MASRLGEMLAALVIGKLVERAMVPPAKNRGADADRLESLERMLAKVEQMQQHQPTSSPPTTKMAVASPPSATVAADHAPAPAPTSLPPQSKPLFKGGNAADRSIATSCVACAQAHLATVSGLLKEAIRFARTGGIADMEVVHRLSTCLEEIGALERHDWAPENLRASPERDQAIVRAFQERVRVIRQHLTQVGSVEQLEAVAAEAAMVTMDFGLAVLKSRGAKVDGLADTITKARTGEITPEEAKVRMMAALKPTDALTPAAGAAS